MLNKLVQCKISYFVPTKVNTPIHNQNKISFSLALINTIFKLIKRNKGYCFTQLQEKIRVPISEIIQSNAEALHGNEAI